MKKFDLSEYPDFINEYWYHLVLVKGKSKRTAEAYLIDIRLFFRYIIYINSSNDVDFDKIDIADFSLNELEKVNLHKIYDYICFLSDERKNNNKTIARKISSIKSLYKYLTLQVSKIKNNPTLNLETPKINTKNKNPKFLTLEESKTLLKQASESTIESPRDYCIVTLFLNCGMRLSELVGINISDINFDDKIIRILGKGNKERNVYLNEACINAITEYLNSRENSVIEPQAFFLSKRGGRISQRRVEQIVEQLLKQCGLSGKGISVHKLRHTAATLMYKYGKVDIRTLQKVLGHENISTTQIYTHVYDDSVKEAFESSPLAYINNESKKSDSEE